MMFCVCPQVRPLVLMVVMRRHRPIWMTSGMDAPTGTPVSVKVPLVALDVKVVADGKRRAAARIARDAGGDGLAPPPLPALGIMTMAL